MKTDLSTIIPVCTIFFFITAIVRSTAKQ